MSYSGRITHSVVTGDFAEMAVRFLVAYLLIAALIIAPIAIYMRVRARRRNPSKLGRF